MSRAGRWLAILASILLLLLPASASEVWLVAGVSVVYRDPQWQGIRTDSAQMWMPDAPWQKVASQTKVVLLPPGAILRAKDDDSLRQAFGDMRQRNLALALEMGLLTRTDRCQYKGEGYLDDIQTVKNALERIRRTGGDLRYIAMDEPFYYAHQYSGPGACHEPTAEIARRVAASVLVARSIFPTLQIGDEEVVNSSRAATVELAEWAAAYRAAVGEPLDFLHADVEWSGLAMQNLKPLAVALKQQHVAFGIIYNAAGDATTDEAWAESATEHYTEVEQVLDVHPDHAVFQTWVHSPTRMMPEDQPATLTNIALHYLQPATTLSFNRVGDGVTGRLMDSQGHPVAGARLTLEAVDVVGHLPPQARQWTGTIPQAAKTAIIGIRANTESSCVCDGDTAATVGLIHYSEVGTGLQQEIPPGAPPIPRTIKLSASQNIVWNLKQIPVTAGAAYTLSVPIAAAASAESAGYVTAIFFDGAGKGLGRVMIPFRPVRQQIAQVTTGSDGSFTLAIPANLVAAHAELRAYFSGTATLHPAMASMTP
jgi:hypothetical protein